MRPVYVRISFSSLSAKNAYTVKDSPIIRVSPLCMLIVRTGHLPIRYALNDIFTFYMGDPQDGQT